MTVIPAKAGIHADVGRDSSATVIPAKAGIHADVGRDSCATVIPAKAGIHADVGRDSWIPAFAGMTVPGRMLVHCRTAFLAQVT
jgi:hypothetical protein